ncbi:MAG: LysM peptidoglycan-binding domain-containing protein, partial [Paracoccaceae bacterium]
MTRSLTRFPVASLIAGLMLSACSSTTPLDWDLRSGQGGPDTSAAALQATAEPPRADARGILSYPGYQVAVARRGDTVGSLAARIGVDAGELARLNALQPTDSLRDGETLSVPGRVAGAAGPGTGGVIGSGATGVDVSTIATTALDRVGGETPAPGAAAKPVGPEPERHRVARGETAFSIARSYNVSARALADWNGLGPDLAVREGQFLLIPVASGEAPPAPVESAPGAGTQTPEPPSAKEPLPDEKPAPAAEKPKETPASPDLGSQRTGASAAKLAMPVEGKIIRGYSKGKNDGIDIAAAAGTGVKAAADGTVAAITKDTAGTPIVVIRHADNLLTVYAGVDGVSVAKG